MAAGRGWLPRSCYPGSFGTLSLADGLAGVRREAGRRLVLSGPADLPGPAAALLREHRAEIRAAAEAIGAETSGCSGQ